MYKILILGFGTYKQHTG